MRKRGGRTRGIAGACSGMVLLCTPLMALAEGWMQMNMSGHNCQASGGKLSYDDEGAYAKTTALTVWCPLVTSSGQVTTPFRDGAPYHATLAMSVVYVASPTGTGEVVCTGYVRDYLRGVGAGTVSHSSWWTLEGRGTVTKPDPPVDAERGFMTLPFRDGVGGLIGGGDAQKAYIVCTLPAPLAMFFPSHIIAYSVAYDQ